SISHIRRASTPERTAVPTRWQSWISEREEMVIGQNPALESSYTTSTFKEDSIVQQLLLVAVGGSLGAIARYGTGLWAARLLGKGFPWGTLIVNVLGCFIMGIVVEIMLDLEAHTVEAITPAIRRQMAFWHQGVALGF